jgi:glycosyltransferase involved in cell wall biosynthesis
MVGRIAPWKGQHVFIEAFARAFPNGASEAVIVGAPLFGREEEDYLEHILRLGDELGLGQRLVYTGFSDDVAAELARLDVVVHASLKPEPFGQVILEGMAAGLPVVAARAGGPLELVTDGLDGLLYPPGDVEALARLLTHLARDASLRVRLGDAGILRAQGFSVESVAAQLTEIYRSVLTK